MGKCFSHQILSLSNLFGTVISSQLVTQSVLREPLVGILWSLSHDSLMDVYLTTFSLIVLFTSISVPLWWGRWIKTSHSPLFFFLPPPLPHLHWSFLPPPLPPAAAHPPLLSLPNLLLQEPLCSPKPKNYTSVVRMKRLKKGENNCLMWSKYLMWAKHLGNWKLEAKNNSPQSQVGRHHCPEQVSDWLLYYYIDYYSDNTRKKRCFL